MHIGHLPTIMLSMQNTVLDLQNLIATSHFLKKPSDDKLAKELRNGTIPFRSDVKIKETSFAETLTSDSTERDVLLFLNTLRWLDIFRRTSSKTHLDTSIQLQTVNEWWHCATSDNSCKSIAWLPNIVVQRSIFLALNLELSSDLAAEIYQKHIAELCSMIETTSQSAEIRKLTSIIMLLRLGALGNPSREKLSPGSELLDSLSRRFSSSRVFVGPSLTDMMNESSKWQNWCSIFDPSEQISQLLPTKRDLRKYWSSLAKPTGGIVPIGSSKPEIDTIKEQFGTYYEYTSGNSGNPPEELSFLDPSISFTVRSGWGETERLFTEESLWSMIVGDVRSRTGHHDIGRLTWSSQGIDWLQDPSNATTIAQEDHTCISLDSHIYRPIGGTKLIRHRTDDNVEEAIFSLSTYRGLQWRRHMSYSKSGNFVVMEDLLRSREPISGYRNFILGLETACSFTENGLKLSNNGKIAHIHLAQSPDGAKVDTLSDENGNPIARRVRVPFTGNGSVRLLMVFADQQSEDFSIRRLMIPGNEFAFEISDKYVDQQIMVTPVGSAIFPRGTDPEDSLQRTESLLADGGLSIQEVRDQRLLARKKILEAKNLAWAASDPENRLSIATVLLEEASESRINGLRNHGIVAAAVDIAGDTSKLLASTKNTLLDNLRRTPLINFSGLNESQQEYYKIEIESSRSTTSMPINTTEPTIWSVDLGQLIPSSLIIDSPGDTLTVYFHGATDRNRLSLPRYERVRSFSQINRGPVMYFSDPTLDLDSRAILTWFLGTEEINLHRKIAEMISTYAQRRQVRHVMLVGNSGGGFAAMQVASHLHGAGVVSVNAQINLLDYQPRVTNMALEACFGKEIVALNSEEQERISAEITYLKRQPCTNLLMVQNTGDQHHYNEHFLPFDRMMRTYSPIADYEVSEKFFGDGHVAPPQDEYVRIVQNRIDRLKEQDFQFNGLAK